MQLRSLHFLHPYNKGLGRTRDSLHAARSARLMLRSLDRMSESQKTPGMCWVFFVEVLILVRFHFQLARFELDA